MGIFLFENFYIEVAAFFFCGNLSYRWWRYCFIFRGVFRLVLRESFGNVGVGGVVGEDGVVRMGNFIVLLNVNFLLVIVLF